MGPETNGLPQNWVNIQPALTETDANCEARSSIEALCELRRSRSRVLTSIPAHDGVTGLDVVGWERSLAKLERCLSSLCAANV